MSVLDEIKLRGQPLARHSLHEALIVVNISLAVEQVSQLTMTFDDPNFNILRSGLLKKNTPVTYQGLDLIIAGVTTIEGSGLGGVEVQCRPSAVEKLKALRGPFTMGKATAGAYVRRECKKAGVPVGIIQNTGGRKKIKRDKKVKGEHYEPQDFPSAWTTFARLATDLGFLAYEMQGKIYFGQPTFISEQRPLFTASYGGDTGNEVLSIPDCHYSIDSTDIDINIEVDMHLAKNIIPGGRLQLKGLPEFAGTYFLTEASYDVYGSQENRIQVTGSTLKNPWPAAKTAKSKNKKKSKEDKE